MNVKIQLLFVVVAGVVYAAYKEHQRRQDMAKVSEEIKDLTARFDAATTAVGKRIDDLATAIEEAGGDKIATEEAIAGLRKEADDLEALGGTVQPPPVPPINPANP